MSGLKKHLRVAIRHLKLEHTELDHALDHALSEEYAEPWVEAIDKAVKTNRETTTHVQNILTTIKHPRAQDFGRKPGKIRPGRQ